MERSHTKYNIYDALLYCALLKEVPKMTSLYVLHSYVLPFFQLNRMDARRRAEGFTPVFPLQPVVMAID